MIERTPILETDVMSQQPPQELAAMQLRKSRLEIIALLAEIIAALAVVLSVIYLAMQVSANNRLLQSQSTNNMMASIHTNMLQIATNPEFAALTVRCGQNPYAVTEVEWLRCASYYHATVDQWEYAFNQYQSGSMPPDYWTGIDAGIKHFTTVELGFQRFWRERSDFYGRDFYVYVDPIIPNIAPPEPVNVTSEGVE